MEKKGVTVGGKGAEGTVTHGKNSNNKQTTIVCFISLPFLHISSSACIKWSLNSALPRRFPCCLVYMLFSLPCSLIISIIIWLWYYVLSQKSAFLSVGLMIWLDSIYLTLQPLLFVEIFFHSLSLKCCKNTHLLLAGVEVLADHSLRVQSCCGSCTADKPHQSGRQMDKAGCRSGKGVISSAAWERCSAKNAMWISQLGEDDEMEMWGENEEK